MSVEYVKAPDTVDGIYTVIRITDDPAYTVVAKVDTEARAAQIASLLTAVAA